MRLSVAETGHGVPVLHVSGEVDLGTEPALRTATDDLLARHSGLIVIDLSEVTFLDSAGLKVLDDMQRTALVAGGRIALVSPQQRILRLLEITGLTDRFAIHDSAEDAASGDR